MYLTGPRKRACVKNVNKRPRWAVDVWLGKRSRRVDPCSAAACLVYFLIPNAAISNYATVV